MTRILISGGGTGGHVFPAIAIANAIKRQAADAEILFIGARGKLEMEKVPAAGYPIRGLWISGLQRRLTLKNLSFPFKVVWSLFTARQIIRSFRPAVVIGVGGYASGPTVRIAAGRKIPTLIQEQNSFPGITNRMLAGKADLICVAFEGMERFFPKEKVLLTGNPVRQDILTNGEKRPQALEYFGLKKDKSTVLVLGGSLGSRTINRSMLRCLEGDFARTGLQILWQTGNHYYEPVMSDPLTAAGKDLRILPFIDRMDLAYAAADIIISRAGAIAISELCVIGKPVILIPSPNVAEDHQTKNAQALVNKEAVLMIPDAEAEEKLCGELAALACDGDLQKKLTKNIAALALTDAADRIAEEALKMAGVKK
ncbi:MAG TPA: undecaprenyldiphospho-muramoylpentapeptide beta-N-acetylglucosaminyltransferase [Bacteroidales bacterium]|nr:undecaprenyldiphospho-muramoylpentapeptide beta-N-acetylglucosaminyltransferase [Bacteroidales bacterium]